MMLIPLTKGLFAIVDDEGFAWLSQYKWFADVRPLRACAARRRRNDDHNRSVAKLLMHREILQPPDGMVVDHINGDALDNRRENLRIATTSQNAMNKRKTPRKKLSIYKGVSWHSAYRRWHVTLEKEGRRIYVGSSKSEEEAARMYDARAMVEFGEFAKLNFPEGGVE